MAPNVNQISDVFISGNEGFGNYRIPSLLKTSSEGLLAFCEAREILSDHANNKMVLKRSFDQGLTWPEENQLELYENLCSGYSCMTKVDKNHIGIYYEGYSENLLLKNKHQ